MSTGVGSITSPSPAYAAAATGAPVAAAASAGVSATQTVAPPALYASFGAAFAAGLHGLRAPQNPEDGAMILAQLALAVDAADQEGSSNRIAGALSGLRAGLGAAIAGIVGAAAKIAVKTAERAAAQVEFAASTTQQNGLTAQRGALTTEAGRLTMLISDATAGETAIAEARAALSTTNASLAEVNASLVTVADKIATAAAAIARLDGAIAGLATSDAERNLALVSVFSQIAVFLQTGGSERSRSGERSADLDRLLDDVAQTLRQFQQDSVAAAEAVARTGREADDAEAGRRVAQTALGLLSGLADLLQMLRQFRDEPVATLQGADDELARRQLAV